MLKMKTSQQTLPALFVPHGAPTLALKPGAVGATMRAVAHPSEEHLLPLYVALGAAGPHYTAERLYSGIADFVLAMDMFALRPAPLTPFKETR